jgi:hypothetical protein
MRAACPVYINLPDFVILIYWAKSTNHEAPRYAIFSILQSNIPLISLFSNIFCSMLISETKLYTHTKLRAEL